VDITIVDSGSTDAIAEAVAQELPAARFVDLHRNVGYAAAINRGAAVCGLPGPVVVLNPDTRLQPGALRALVDAVDEPGIGITVPRLVEEDGDTARSLRRRPTVLRAWGEALLGGSRAGRFPRFGEVVQDEAAYERPGTFGWATGAVMCISRPCLEAVGAWDESFFLYSEETDFAVRAATEGFALRYVPEALAVHTRGAAMRDGPLFALLTVNRVHAYRKFHGAARSAMFRLALLTNSAARAARRDSPHRSAVRALVRPRKDTVARARVHADGPRLTS
jgi:GT2 family glycosyltransferase